MEQADIYRNLNYFWLPNSFSLFLGGSPAVVWRIHIYFIQYIRLRIVYDYCKQTWTCFFIWTLHHPRHVTLFMFRVVLRTRVWKLYFGSLIMFKIIIFNDFPPLINIKNGGKDIIISFMIHLYSQSQCTRSKNVIL